jgi:hypothetical protein
MKAESDEATLARPLTSELIRPFARTSFYMMRRARAQARASIGRSSIRNDPAPIFIIGCGRSGTTLLGELFSMHPTVSYKYEPYDLWTGVDPITDFLQLYSSGDYHCLLDATTVTDSARRRFRRLFATKQGYALVEKSPINALRIGFLEALEPAARFIHIVRDGVDVAHSIARVAAVTRRMAFRSPLNQWWGVGDAKWAALRRDGKAVNYYPEEVDHLVTDAQRGAYEWLLSLREVEAWQERLGSRICEVRYQDLTSQPQHTLQELTDSLGLSSPDSWLEEITAHVRPIKAESCEPLILPGQMRADFNRFQTRFAFRGRAVSETQ